GGGGPLAFFGGVSRRGGAHGSRLRLRRGDEPDRVWRRPRRGSAGGALARGAHPLRFGDGGTGRNPRAPACTKRRGFHGARSPRGAARRRASHHPLGRRARLVARSPRRRIGSDRQRTDCFVSFARIARCRRAEAGRNRRHSRWLCRRRGGEGRLGGGLPRCSISHRAGANGWKRDGGRRRQRACEGRNMSAPGKLVGVGVGPGDPELITLKAVRVLEQADVVVHFTKAGNSGNARTIAARYLKPGIRELPLRFPVTTELPRDEAPYCDAVRAFYDAAARDVASSLDDGRLVAVVCEGDPLFYGSYMHLHVRLADRFRTEVVAGVSGMSGCWSAVGTPMAQGDDVFSVLPGTLAQDELERRLNETDAVVVIKLGRNLPKVRRALERTGRLARAVYVERGTMTDERAIPLAAKPDDCAPYFAMVLVPGRGGRPWGATLP